ncbi:hypothetical protein CHS0354_023940 [Potamilus streckersoni]|uniref:glutamate-1-semialdehyde 2,1-aminomutase n=1 Tax=Potamilus streckersoni TaxID=2493646 RepID=A0AAE0RZ48_9BIVA|nr:hypothetical protein CHS0354_023940 [Potamilus streckersoni]
MPRIGDSAPDFDAITTIGNVKFSEFIKGSWVILFSHPADFTPVCTTELIGFATEKEFFKAHNTKLIGLSIDSIHSHIAWVHAIQEKTSTLLEYPIIADIDMKVSKLYGMIQPGESETATVRAVFVIDPQGKVRLIMYYPLNVGRNMDEIKRTLVALQTADDNKCALPLNWKKGEKIVVPAPRTVEALTERKATYFLRAKKVIPGGVNSPVRAFKSVGGDPLFIKKGNGSKIWDEDGNEFIDFVCSWGALLYGHSHPRVQSALKSVIEHIGTSFGAPTLREVEFAELIQILVPAAEMVRLVSSGTEATMTAIRIARGYTGKDKIIKFEGCYHGHGDSFLIKAGSGATTMGTPDSLGIPKGFLQETLCAEFNNIKSVETLLNANKNQIAAIIIEPVAGNMGVVPAHTDFLKELRKLCTLNNIVLIFDEVMTGFRLSKGGSSELYSITPDLITFGKIIGGGLPVAAYCGKKEIMSYVSPEGGVYQAGTLSGNPLAVAAGIEILTMIKEDPPYNQLNNQAIFFTNELKYTLKKIGMPYQINQVGSMLSLFFTDVPVTNYANAKTSDTKKFAVYFNKMLEQGIYLPPSQFEAMFLSTQISDADISQTIEAFTHALN